MSQQSEELVHFLAVQTAITAALVKHLKQSANIDMEPFILDLYQLLDAHGQTGAKPHFAGPIRHLIALIED